MGHGCVISLHIHKRLFFRRVSISDGGRRRRVHVKHLPCHLACHDIVLTTYEALRPGTECHSQSNGNVIVCICSSVRKKEVAYPRNHNVQTNVRNCWVCFWGGGLIFFLVMKIKLWWRVNVPESANWLGKIRLLGPSYCNKAASLLCRGCVLRRGGVTAVFPKRECFYCVVNCAR